MANWKDNIQEITKIYIRFLKDNGIFRRAIELHRTHNKSIAVKNFNRNKLLRVLRYTNYPFQFMSDSTAFCTWDDTIEGNEYWWIKSLLWKIECLKNESLRKHFSNEVIYECVISTKQSYKNLNNITHIAKMSENDRKILNFLGKYIKTL